MARAALVSTLLMFIGCVTIPPPVDAAFAPASASEASHYHARSVPRSSEGLGAPPIAAHSPEAAR